MQSTLSRLLQTFVVALPVMLLVRPAQAQAVVHPRSSAPGAYEKYVLRVPNEKTVATTRIEVRFPAGLRVVSFADISGWQLKTITDSAQRISGAVWTGTLPPERFVELPFVAMNPAAGATLVWPTYQTYADGERVEWTGPTSDKHPASQTVIGDAATTGPSGGVATFIMSVAGLALGMLSLGLVLRREPAAVSATEGRPVSP